MISEHLNEFEWESELAGQTSHQQYEKLLNILNSLVDRYIPTVPCNISSTPWSKNPPRALTREKSVRWGTYKDCRRQLGRRHPDTLTAWRNFTDANSRIKQFTANSQAQYEKTIAEQIKTNPKLFHSYLRHKRVG